MRKTAIVLLVLVTALVFSLPQYCSAQGLSLGIKGGVNMPNLSGTLLDSISFVSPEANTGVAVGGYATISLLPNIAIQPEIYYSQKGAKTTGSLLGISYEGNARINYLEIPVLAKISFGAIVKPYIVAGPYFATKLGSDLTFSVAGLSVPIDSFDTYIKDSDMGVTVGVGVQTPIKLSIEGRYSLGVGSIYNGPGDLDLKNTNIQILIGYAIF